MSASVGDSRTVVVVDDLTRTQIVQFAGASGDYNPVHTDDRFATEVAGYPSVFAHGMLTMGLAGRVVTDWFGVDALDSYQARFLNQVWPGDTLSATATITNMSDDGRTANLDILTVNQNGITVLSGSASVRLAGTKST